MIGFRGVSVDDQDRFALEVICAAARGPERPPVPRAARRAGPRLLGDARRTSRGSRRATSRSTSRPRPRSSTRRARACSSSCAACSMAPPPRRRARARAPPPGRQLRDRPPAQRRARAPRSPRRAATGSAPTRARDYPEPIRAVTGRGRAARGAADHRPRRLHARRDPALTSLAPLAPRADTSVAPLGSPPAALAARRGGVTHSSARPAAISARKTGPRSRALTSPMPRMPRRRSVEVGLTAASSWSVRSPKMR